MFSSRVSSSAPGPMLHFLFFMCLGIVSEALSKRTPFHPPPHRSRPPPTPLGVLCPNTCEASASVNLKQISHTLVRVSVFHRTASFCRRSCYQLASNLTYYAYNETGNGACYCFEECSTPLLPLGKDQLVLGNGANCSDLLCPISCENGLGFAFISRPAADAHTVLPREKDYRAKGCRKFCRGQAGHMKFYEQDVSGDCYCYKHCNATKAFPGINVPGRLGFLPACHRAKIP